MRAPWPLLSCLVILLSAGPPALAQLRPETQPVSLDLAPQDAEKSSIGFVNLPPADCHPVYAPGVRQVGSPVAEAEAEQQTQGLVVAGHACDDRR